MEEYSAHLDTFARDNLPAESLQPEFIFSDIPELEYPHRINCAVELLDKMVDAGHAESPLFHTEQAVSSYQDFLNCTNQIANLLVRDFGLVPGNRVLLRGPNTPMLAACWFAVQKAGGICVTTMPLLRAKELGYIAEKAQVKFCLCDSRWDEEVEITKRESDFLSTVIYFNGGRPDALETLITPKSTSFDNVVTAAEDISLIAFTSGTTGKPKAAMHNHRDVMAICDTFPRYIVKPSASDVFAGTPPLAFTFGLGGLLLFPMRFGASIAMVEKPGPDSLLEVLQRSKVTTCFTSPTAYRAILDKIKDYDLSALTTCVSAGEPLPVPTFKAWQEATGIKIIDGIGATELLHIFISAAGDDIRPGATGKVVPGYRAAILDQEGKPVPDGEVGFLAVKGPTGCRYLDDEDRQKEYVKNGWNFTGDAYKQDADGYFWFHSRADDMIISAGYNISGLEVEAALLAHQDVKECGVVAWPDEERGHIVKAFIVLREGASASAEKTKELQDYVKAEIAPYKYPRAVEFVESLPRTETGKLQRFQLRAEHLSS